MEEMLFESLDDDDQRGVITLLSLDWLEQEKRKQRRKEKAKAEAQCKSEMRRRQREEERTAVRDFKNFLIKRQGCLFKAWRQDLDIDCSMTVTRKELFRACKDIGWQGDVRTLWRALDT